jgi:hypothetical protein
MEAVDTDWGRRGTGADLLPRRADQGCVHHARARLVHVLPEASALPRAQEGIVKDGRLPDTVEPVIPPAGWVTLSPETYDRFHDGYVALVEALAAYRSALRSGERESEQLRELGDAALAMKANLAAREAGPYNDPSCPPDTMAG